MNRMKKTYNFLIAFIVLFSALGMNFNAESVNNEVTGSGQEQGVNADAMANGQKQKDSTQEEQNEGAIDTEFIQQSEVEENTFEAVPLSIHTEIEEIRARAAGASVSFELDDMNATLKDETDYHFGDPSQVIFGVDFDVIPLNYVQKNRTVTVEIPRYFGIEKDTLEVLSGSTFANVSVDYAGWFDFATNAFVWVDGKDKTTITFTLHDSATEDDDIPIGISFNIYQDYAQIGAHGVSPSISYPFVVSTNMDGDTGGFTFEIPFEKESIRINGVKTADKISSEVDALGNQIFTIEDGSVYLGTNTGDENYNMAYPLNLLPIDFAFTLEKSETALPLTKYNISIPIPKGYVLNNTGSTLVIPKGGQNGGNLSLADSGDGTWIVFDAVTNTVKISLDDIVAEGLLKDHDVKGTNIGALKLRMQRVNPDNSKYDRATNPLIPYNLRDGESLKAAQSIAYEFTTEDNIATTSTGNTMQINLRKLANQYAFIGNDRTNITKTQTGMMPNAFNLAANNNVWKSAYYKEVVVNYNFSQMNSTKTKVTLDKIGASTAYIDKDMKVTLSYVDKLDVDQKADITKISGVGINAKMQELVIKNLPFYADIAEITDVSFTSKYLIGKGSRELAVQPGFVFSTDTSPVANNDPESFIILSTMVSEGVEVIRKDYVIDLLSNTQEIKVAVEEKKGTLIAQGREVGQAAKYYAGGSWIITKNHPATPGAKMHLVSGVNDENGLQFVDELQLTGMTGKIEYKLVGDATIYTQAVTTNNAEITFPEVDFATGKVLEYLEVIPNGMDDNTAGKNIGWKLYYKNNISPSKYVSGLAIPNGNYATIAANILSKSGGNLASASGTTFSLSDVNIPITFKTPWQNLSGAETIYIGRDYTPNFILSTFAETKDKSFSTLYSSVEQGIDFSDATLTADTLDILSLLGGMTLVTTPTTEKGTVDVTYTVFNHKTGVTKDKTASLNKIKDGDTITFDITDDESVSNIKYKTDIFSTPNEIRVFGFRYTLRDQIMLDTKYGNPIKLDASYKIPVTLTGMVQGETVATDYGIENSFTPVFKVPRLVSEIIKDDTKKYFNTHKLEQPFIETTNPAFAYIVKGKSFTHPVLQWSFNPAFDFAAIKDAAFSIKDSLSLDLLSSIGYVQIVTTRNANMKGTVDYTVYNKTTGLTDVKTVAIKGQSATETIQLPTSSDEVINDIIIRADNLENFNNNGGYQVSYFFKDNLTVDTLYADNVAKKLVNDSGSSAQVQIIYDELGNTTKVNSVPGSSIKFYAQNNRFKIKPNTTYPNLTYYSETPAGNTTGFSFTTYNDTQTYYNAAFKFSANAINKQIFALTEGIVITNPQADGTVYYTLNDGTTKSTKLEKSKTLNADFTMGADEYVTNIWIEMPEIKSAVTPSHGDEMNVSFRLSKPLGAQTRDKNILSPVQSFELKVHFTAVNYDVGTGLETFPGKGEEPGALGIRHANKNLETAKFGTYDVPKVPENFMMNLWTPNPKEDIKDAYATGAPVELSRNIFQGENIAFSHEPTIQWQFPQKQTAPDKAFLDNPKFYYVIDERFTYKTGSLRFYDADGLPMEVDVYHHQAMGNPTESLR